MIETVLVPMDDSEMAERALVFALEAYPDATVTVLHVVGEPSPFLGEATGIALADDVERTAERLAAPIFDGARAIAREYDADIRTQFALGPPAKAIVKHAGEYDVVVVGSHGSDLRSRILMGDVARKVSRRSPVPVTVVR